MVTGLAWWLVWIPVMMVLAGLVGVDLYAHAPSVVWIGLAIGIPGLLATWWFHRWSHRPVRAEFGKRVDDSAAGGSIRKTQRDPGRDREIRTGVNRLSAQKNGAGFPAPFLYRR